VSHKSGAIGELHYLVKYGKNVKREKLLQIICFQSQVFEFFTQAEPLRHYTLDTSVTKCYGDVAMLTWW
jgi:hypothetical protein